jgi:predicted transcriptional regulator
MAEKQMQEIPRQLIELIKDLNRYISWTSKLTIILNPEETIIESLFKA